MYIQTIESIGINAETELNDLEMQERLAENPFRTLTLVQAVMNIVDDNFDEYNLITNAQIVAEIEINRLSKLN